MEVIASFLYPYLSGCLLNVDAIPLLHHLIYKESLSLLYSMGYATHDIGCFIIYIYATYPAWREEMFDKKEWQYIYTARTNNISWFIHYSDVIMSAMASQITNLLNRSFMHWSKHQNSASLAFVRGIHRWPVDSPHRGPVTRRCFHLMTSSCPEYALSFGSVYNPPKSCCNMINPWRFHGFVHSRTLLAVWTVDLPVQNMYSEILKNNFYP